MNKLTKYDTCFYLSGEQIKNLKDLNCTHVLIGKSQMVQYAGHITMIYFGRFNDNGCFLEQAQVGLFNDIQPYRRQWGIGMTAPYSVRALPNEVTHESRYLFK